MYTQYWNLKEKPFETTPDPRFIYYSREYEEALMRLFYTVREQKGAMLLTGRYGCGKTVLSRVFLNELAGSKYEVALVNNPRCSSRELLEEIVYQLGQGNHHNKSKVELLRIFNDVIYANLTAHKETIIVIDEAQAIEDVETFEELRLLLNFQQNDRYLLSLILVGQPELRKKLESLPQLMQRLAMRYHLDALSEEDTISYIDHRLHVAGATEQIFNFEAKKAVYKFSSGIPRCINNIADLALLTAYGENKKIIDANIIDRVEADINGEVVWSDSLIS
ncbi:MAG: AAA family ATPase [Candidatus Omnitrophica bacterium]|nr:AAA family ATPase [Candidatus Omnitrophota bacterium]